MRTIDPTSDSTLRSSELAARDLETSMPWPEVRVRFAENGLRFEVRYPVEADHAVAIDQKMLKSVRDTLEREPKLPVAGSGEPALEHSEV